MTPSAFLIDPVTLGAIVNCRRTYVAPSFVSAAVAAAVPDVLIVPPNLIARPGAIGAPFDDDGAAEVGTYTVTDA